MRSLVLLIMATMVLAGCTGLASDIDSNKYRGEQPPAGGAHDGSTAMLDQMQSRRQDRDCAGGNLFGALVACVWKHCTYNTDQGKFMFRINVPQETQQCPTVSQAYDQYLKEMNGRAPSWIEAEIARTGRTAHASKTTEVAETSKAAQVDIRQMGEQAVSQWLRSKGYEAKVSARDPTLADIEARGSGGNLLVQVKAAVLPSSPSYLSSEEERDIRARAARLGFQAWEARVQLDQENRQVGAIVWRRLDA